MPNIQRLYRGRLLTTSNILSGNYNYFRISIIVKMSSIYINHTISFKLSTKAEVLKYGGSDIKITHFFAAKINELGDKCYGILTQCISLMNTPEWHTPSHIFLDNRQRERRSIAAVEPAVSHFRLVRFRDRIKKIDIRCRLYASIDIL